MAINSDLPELVLLGHLLFCRFHPKYPSTLAIERVVAIQSLPEYTGYSLLISLFGIL